jgi:hypothetical protein
MLARKVDWLKSVLMGTESIPELMMLRLVMRMAAMPVMMMFILRCLWLLKHTVQSAVYVALSFNSDFGMNMFVILLSFLFSSTQIEVLLYSTEVPQI